MALRVPGVVLLLSALLAVATPASEDLYRGEIKPLLEHKCYACHGALKQKGGLRLDTGKFIRRGGKHGPAVDAGNPSASLLLKKVTAEDESERMPQEAGALTEAEVSLLHRWIDAGAMSPADENAMKNPSAYWSYQKPVRPKVPVVRNADNPIDAFVWAQREKRGLSTTEEADPAVLLRRVYLDLIGLPPTRDELHDFLADPSSQAYAKIVDDLLDRPQYGERWGRHWMDVWRYSDWYGRRGQNEIRYSLRHIWRWRDWIIRSLNEDKGYDRMVQEMLAGDELAPTDEGALAATGFIGRNWYKFDRNVWLFETVEHTSQAFLGMTMRCARCHDHKYDPIEQADYYRFRAFFEPHGVRTDALDANTELVVDNGADKVLAEGLSRVFDKDLETPTWLFTRGDDRRPDKSKPMLPGVPASLGGEVKIEPVDLPVEAFYPALRKEVVKGELAKFDEKIEAKTAAVNSAKKRVGGAEQRLPSHQEKPNEGQQGKLIWSDGFGIESKDSWKPLNGKWTFAEGKLTQDQVTSFATMLSQRDHPRDFQLRYRYRALEPGTVRSIGVSFDYVDKGNSQDFYSSTGDERQSVQVFHRKGGKQIYPQSGILRLPLSLGDTVIVELEVRGQYLAIDIDGERQLEYIMPLPRLADGGKLALWVHSGAAEFFDIELREVGKTQSDREQDVADAKFTVKRELAELEMIERERRAFLAQLAADEAHYSKPRPADADEKMNEALRVRSIVRDGQARLDQVIAERHLEAVEELAAVVSYPTQGDAVKEAKARLQEIEKMIVKATADGLVEDPGGVLEPLGEIFPATSSGRRLALAHWITSAENPRAARVAINHLWLRHFGEALVPSLSDFGMAGKEPSHPHLLDCLAMELVDNGWRMKEIHRLMVTSETYRLASRAGAGAEAEHNLKTDPNNRWYWRANSRRMEAEVVRDSVLAVAGAIDLTPFGPEIADSLGMKNKRRSVYFRSTPDNQMPMLAQFDMANPNACYRREESVAPQQSLTLMNGGLLLDHSRLLARELSANSKDDEEFSKVAFETVLNRPADSSELATMIHYLQTESAAEAKAGDEFSGAGKATVAPSADPVLRARENLIHVLFNHNDFVTIR